MKWLDKKIDDEHNALMELLEQKFYERTGKRVKIDEMAESPDKFDGFTLEDHQVYCAIMQQGIDHLKRRNRRMITLSIAVFTIATASLSMYIKIRSLTALLVSLSITAILFFLIYLEEKEWKNPKIK